MLCLGIDPDLHDLAIASWDDQGPVAGHVVHVPRVKGRVENEAVLAMMTELTKPWPQFGRPVQAERPWNAQPAEDREMPEWCAVEAQELARGPGAQHRRPQDIVTLGQVAGMAVMRVARDYYLHGCGLYFPKPSEWKGSVPKHVMQARLYTELGWGYTFAAKNAYALPSTLKGVPLGAFRVNSGQWKHLGDALLLARWCWEQASGRPWQPGVR